MTGHWLLFDAERHITGCHCGFIASLDDCGYGDSVLGHFKEVVLAERIAQPSRPLLAELCRAADEYAVMPDWAKPVKTDPDALIAGRPNLPDASAPSDGEST